ncbi:MAG: hypothetical protein ABFD97_13065 [Syntrophobacter sp.]
MIQRKVLIVVILALCMTACGGHKRQLPLIPLKMTVDISTDPAVNNGEVFWMVVREVDADQFSRDTYEEIESNVLANEWGPDVLNVCAVVPGGTHKITIPKPMYRPAAFYFLFSWQQDYWKVLLPQPVKSKCRLHIEQHRAYIEPLKGTW